MSPGTKLIIGFLITNEMQDKAVTITPKTVVVEESVSNVKKNEELKKQTDEPKKDIAKTEPVVTGRISFKRKEKR